MLRSTFAAYNEAHPDKPLINPRNAAAGTLRAKDPAVVAERRMSFFAFDLDSSDGDALDDVEAALRTLGFDAADMRHCDDADAAIAVIGEIEAQRTALARGDAARRLPVYNSLWQALQRGAPTE